MTNVHPLPTPDLLGDAGAAAVDDGPMLRLARQAFDEAADAGCSFADCLAAVFEAGVRSITGAPKRRAPRKAAIPPCPYDEIVATYHAHLPEFPRVGVQTGNLWTKRKKAMAELWTFVLTSEKSDGTRRAQTAQQAMAWIAKYFERVHDNDFLMGRTPRVESHKNWRPDFDYLLTPNGMKQVLEKTPTN